jgi:hypothetical protein
VSANDFRPHVKVIPEDEANRQIANGFLIEAGATREMQVLEVAGGWLKVIESFQSVHARELDRCSERLVILLIDFDGDEQRPSFVKEHVPERLRDRVFILGVQTEPEALRTVPAVTNRSVEPSRGIAAREPTPLGAMNSCDAMRPKSHVCANVSSRSCFPDAFF